MAVVQTYRGGSEKVLHVDQTKREVFDVDPGASHSVALRLGSIGVTPEDYEQGAGDESHPGGLTFSSDGDCD
jgi:hypothetical protein